MIEFLAIDHIYISAIVRVLRAEADNKLKREVINKLISYMEKKFPNFKENKYINTLTRNRRIIYNLISAKTYGLVNALFFSPTYLNSGSLVSLPTKTTLFIQYRLLIYIYFVLSVGL